MSAYIGPLTPKQLANLRGAIRSWNEQDACESAAELACGMRAQEAVMNARNADVVLFLTVNEAKGLLALAGEGAAGLFTDAEAAKAYIGNKKAIDAAGRALEKLMDAVK